MVVVRIEVSEWIFISDIRSKWIMLRKKLESRMILKILLRKPEKIAALTAKGNRLMKKSHIGVLNILSLVDMKVMSKGTKIKRTSLT